MTRQQAMEITREMRDAGHTWRGIADHLNDAGSRIKDDSLWRASNLYSAYDRWVKQGCQPPEPSAKRLPPPGNATSVHGPLARPPHEILAGDPTNAAAIADLADRRRYFDEQRLDTQAIRQINLMYHKGARA